MGCLVAVVFWFGVYMVWTGHIFVGPVLLGMALLCAFVASLDD